MDDAMRSFDGVLAEKPTNLVALLGKVRQSFYPNASLLTLHRHAFYMRVEITKMR